MWIFPHAIACGSLNFWFMRRAQAILILVTLIALPLAALLQASQMPACGCACCARHLAGAKETQMKMQLSCERNASSGSCNCSMRSSNGNGDLGLSPTLPPTLLSSVMALIPPSAGQFAIRPAKQGCSAGILRDLFQPPEV